MYITTAETINFMNMTKLVLSDFVFILSRILLLAVIITGFAIIYIIMKNLFQIKDYIEEYFKNQSNLKYEKIYNQNCINMQEKVKYSNELIIYIQKITREIALMKFNEFKDSHNLEKINITNMKDVVEMVAKEINESFDKQYPDFEYLLFKEKFFNKYITYYTIYVCKKLIEEEIEEM